MFWLRTLVTPVWRREAGLVADGGIGMSDRELGRSFGVAHTTVATWLRASTDGRSTLPGL